MTPVTVGIATGLTQTYSGQLYSSSSGLGYSTPVDTSAFLGTLFYTGQGSANVGDYTITPGGLYTGQLGYIITFTSGSLAVTPATLTYTANSASQVAGSGNTSFTGTVSGFVNGDTLATVTTGTAVFTSSTSASSAAGKYAIDGSGLTVDNGNYVLAQASGNATALTITSAGGSTAGGGSSSGAAGEAGMLDGEEDAAASALLTDPAKPGGALGDPAGAAGLSSVVVDPTAMLVATFGAGTPLAVVSAPSASETTAIVSLSQARGLMQGGGGASTDDGAGNDGGSNGQPQDVRVPVSRNSLAEIVNGGVKLPSGVEQQLFVVKN
jgi:hypothetical protein